MSLTYEITRLIHTMPGMDINQNGHDTMKSLTLLVSRSSRMRIQTLGISVFSRHSGVLVGTIEPRCEKTGLRVFYLVPHKPGCAAIELKFRILEVLKRDCTIRVAKTKAYYPCSENKGANQLRSYCAADLRLCFRI